MNPSNTFVILSSKKFPADDYREEKWMGGKYSVEELSSELLENWQTAELKNGLFVPQSNKYLAEDTDVKLSEPSRRWESVKKIEENQFGEIFYKADAVFDLPRGFIILLIRSDIVRQNAKNSSIFDFFPFMLVRLMAEVAYDAETADLHYSFDSDWYALSSVFPNVSHVFGRKCPRTKNVTNI